MEGSHVSLILICYTGIEMILPNKLAIECYVKSMLKYVISPKQVFILVNAYKYTNNECNDIC